MTDVEVAIAAALAGAEVVAAGYGSEHSRLAKTATDFATETDVAAERAIVAVLETHRPGDARTGEESGESGPEAATRRWLIDPLCGTLNFAATTPLMAVNVALVRDGAVGAAAVADPVADELFRAAGTRSPGRRRTYPTRPSRACPGVATGWVGSFGTSGYDVLPNRA
jgi:myo-inositol-1(or 4)-monophosphatase